MILARRHARFKTRLLTPPGGALTIFPGNETPSLRRRRIRDKTMSAISCFNPAQLRTVRQARGRAAALVSDYYCVAPREWRRMPYEVKTLRALDRSEVTDAALAQTVCYNFKRAA